MTNPSPQTAAKAREEYTKVVLQAGYEQNFGTIFEGKIIQMRYGRETPTDTYLAILATDNGQAHNYATVNKTLAAGHTFKDQVDACLEALKPFGVTAGFIADLPSVTMPRGAVLFGMVRDKMRDIAAATNTSWAIQSGKLNVVKNDSYHPGEAIVVNSRTGMIGMPVQTIGGIEVKTLLNPQIQPGRRIKIDQSSIQQAAFSPQYTAEVSNSMIPSIADDGIYKVLVVSHSGDTRGNPYYSDIVCIRADGQGPIPLNISQIGLTLDYPDH
ncbi:hypothetical protein LB518_22725 [Mesorhizobium sp. BR1-1-16]|uniref:phage protein n=1 Tax=Mesorhizobium sp. BR1-1-16 TaxID=2876653 RepID=UPI001CCD9BD5|nr:hypothetical protein [Mesorhizobium sp. BR1-1-16]MBZ9939129.1 hypothetical protein [Mesorhizobium sp. BR1-1-16]